MEWTIARAPRRCFDCNAEFAEGQEYFSALIDTGTTFERRDRCPSCWQNAADRTVAFSFWKTRAPRKQEQTRLLADDDVLWNFFLRLQDDPDPVRQQFCYFLALILMRRRVLKFEDAEKDNGREFLVLRTTRRDRLFRVLNPNLTEEQLDRVKEQIGQILNLSL